MPQLRYLASARDDLVSILTYVSRQSGSLTVAQHFVGRLRERCRSLASLPGTMGRARDELQPGLRSIAFQSYVIFFQYREDRVEIVAVLEGHRDIDAHFSCET